MPWKMVIHVHFEFEVAPILHIVHASVGFWGGFGRVLRGFCFLRCWCLTLRTWFNGGANGLTDPLLTAHPKSRWSTQCPPQKLIQLALVWLLFCAVQILRGGEGNEVSHLSVAMTRFRSLPSYVLL
jgi:hypothetical protein